MSETIGAALRRGAASLANAGIEAPAREARLLLAHALGAEPAALLDTTRTVPTADYDRLLARRRAREPMALIRGRQGFWSLDLAVSSATLIPRADTETLIETLRLACATAPPRRLLDLGTGTGALLLAALTLYPDAYGVGVDRSPYAAMLAAANARENGLSARAMFTVGDWAAAIRGKFDAVLGNPPYVASDDVVRLMPEVARFEPRLALDGGSDGLDAYRLILPALPDLLAPGGIAVLEIGADQADRVEALAKAAGFRESRVQRDLGGNPRAMLLRMTGEKKGLAVSGEAVSFISAREGPAVLTGPDCLRNVAYT